jgi:hypothetical protein
MEFNFKKNSDKTKRIKSLFETYFDGCYGLDPQPNTSNTYTMGVCKLEFDEKDNILTVHLRRPGLLIGKQGKIIDALKKYLECKVKIVEMAHF